MNTDRLKELAGMVAENYDRANVIGSVAIDYIDDQLAQLSEEERYSEKGDIFRYILQKLQE